jgi:5-formyltetrahydrofolate cyclo-ligase
MRAEIDPGQLWETKRRARTAAQELREDAHRRHGPSAGLALARHGVPILPAEGADVVSGFFSFTTEIPVLPLMAKLASSGWTTALPIVQGKNLPLIFRKWFPGEPTIPGIWNIPMPPETAPEVVPDVLLVPMLAFDKRGYRLGYGGGFYDRTLNGLRTHKPIQAIGIAYSDQEVPEVPHGDHDEPMDWILTERGIRKPERP